MGAGVYLAQCQLRTLSSGANDLPKEEWLVVVCMILLGKNMAHSAAKASPATFFYHRFISFQGLAGMEYGPNRD